MAHASQPVFRLTPHSPIPSNGYPWFAQSYPNQNSRRQKISALEAAVETDEEDLSDIPHDNISEPPGKKMNQAQKRPFRSRTFCEDQPLTMDEAQKRPVRSTSSWAELGVLMDDDVEFAVFDQDSGVLLELSGDILENECNTLTSDRNNDMESYNPSNSPLVLDQHHFFSAQDALQYGHRHTLPAITKAERRKLVALQNPHFLDTSENSESSVFSGYGLDIASAIKRCEASDSGDSQSLYCEGSVNSLCSEKSDLLWETQKQYHLQKVNSDVSGVGRPNSERVSTLCGSTD